MHIENQHHTQLRTEHKTRSFHVTSLVETLLTLHHCYTLLSETNRRVILSHVLLKNWNSHNLPASLETPIILYTHTITHHVVQLASAATVTNTIPNVFQESLQTAALVLVRENRQVTPHT